MVTRVYLVRHCQTVGNLTGIFQGGIDTEPSERGLQQLELLALRFRNTKIDKIYSSPLGRALKTAEVINKYHGLDIIPESGIREISVGDIDGRQWAEVPKLYPEAARAWNDDPAEFVSPGGETMREVFGRVREAFLRLAKENQGKTIMLVSHGCALRSLLCFCMGKNIEDMNEVDFGGNTAVSLVEYEDGELKLIFANNDSHLPEEWTRGSKLHQPKFPVESEDKQ